MGLRIEEYNKGILQDETRHNVRIFCIIVALISNFYLLGFMGYKLIKKQRQFNSLFFGAMISITITTIATFYNLLYRFILDENEMKIECAISDIIDEFIIAIARSVLLLFYVLLIYKIFENTKYSIDDNLRNGLFSFIIIIHMLILPSMYITNQTGTAIKTKSFGVYCRNEITGNIGKTGLILYHIIDTIITVVLSVIFIHKLRLLLNDWKQNDDHQTTTTDDDQTSDDEISDNDNIAVTDKLVILMKKRLILMLISVVSSWLIILGGRLDINSNTPLRWIYPLDYVVNGWCIFLLFDWGEMFKCHCLSDKYLSNNNDIEKQ